MRRGIVSSAALACAVVLLSACGPNAYEKLERDRYQFCVSHGGNYTHEDTSAGDHWTCALPGDRELRVPNGDNA